jgi:hypothetical protein
MIDAIFVFGMPFLFVWWSGPGGGYGDGVIVYFVISSTNFEPKFKTKIENEL